MEKNKKIAIIGAALLFTCILISILIVLPGNETNTKKKEVKKSETTKPIIKVYRASQVISKPNGTDSIERTDLIIGKVVELNKHKKTTTLESGTEFKIGSDYDLGDILRIDEKTIYQNCYVKFISLSLVSGYREEYVEFDRQIDVRNTKEILDYFKEKLGHDVVVWWDEELDNSYIRDCPEIKTNEVRILEKAN